MTARYYIRIADSYWLAPGEGTTPHQREAFVYTKHTEPLWAKSLAVVRVPVRHEMG